MSVAEFVAGVDRLLTRAHELYPAGAAAGQLAGGGATSAVPTVPGGASGLAEGAASAGTGYQRSQTSAGTLDQELEQAAGQGAMVAAQGRTGSGAILAQARTFASSAGALGNTPAGAQLVVATMDQHVQAMQTQLQQTRTANEAVSAQLRQVAAGYHSLAGGAKDAPATPLDNTSQHGHDPRYWLDMKQILTLPPGQLPPAGYTQIGPGMYYPSTDQGLFVTPPPPPAQLPVDMHRILHLPPGELPPIGYREMAPGTFFPVPHGSDVPGPWPTPKAPIDVRDIIHTTPGELAPPGYSEYAPNWWAPDVTSPFISGGPR